MSVDGRFGRLERARRPSDEPSGEDDARVDRFEQVEPPRAEPAEPSAPAPRDRFAPPPAPPSPELELAPERDPDTQPFVRCFICGADNSLSDARCLHCRAELNTPEQHAFNERVWAKVRDEHRQEVAALDEKQQRLLGEALAQQAASRTERELGGLGLGEPSGPPIGARLLSRIPDRRVAWAIIAVAVLVPVLLMAFSPYNTRGWRAGFFWLFLEGLLFLPRSSWRRRRWW